MKISRKIIISIIIVFILINICYFHKNSLAAGVLVDDIINALNTADAEWDAPAILANVAHLVIAAAQVGITGFFVIKFTWEGIMYFSATAAFDQAAKKARLQWTFIQGVLAFGITSFIRILYNLIA